MRYFLYTFLTNSTHFISQNSVTNYAAIVCVKHSIAALLFTDMVLPLGLRPMKNFNDWFINIPQNKLLW